MSDVVGLRVILPLKTEVNTAKTIIRNIFDIDEVRSVDKSAQLGTNKVGYRSVHIIARLGDSRNDLPEYRQLTDYFEIQVRTLIEHAWAQIEHDLGYKPTSTVTDVQRRGLALVAGMLELADGKLDELAFSIRGREVKEKKIAIDEQIPSAPRPTTEFGDQSLTIPLIDALLGEALGVHYKERSDYFLKPAGIIRELENFGVHTIGDLIALFPEDFNDFVRSENSNRTTFVGTLRDMMLIRDAERYLTDAWTKEWDELDEQEIIRLGSLGADEDVLRHHLQPAGWNETRIEELVDWFTDNFEDATDIVPYDDVNDEFEYYNGGPYDPIEELDDMFNDRSDKIHSIIEQAVERILHTSTQWVRPGEYS